MMSTYELNQRIKFIAQELETEANKNHIFKEKLIGNLTPVPVLKNADSITKVASDSGAFFLEKPISISYKSVNSQSYYIRLQVPKEDLNRDNLEEIMKEIASSMKRNLAIRDDVVSYGFSRLTFKMPGRSGENEYLLETSDGTSYEFRAYADFAFAVKE